MRGFQTGGAPSVLLVHGAFADAASWAGVIAELREAGVDDVVAPANPLRALSSDAAYLASVVAHVDGPVLLVGHCYGGAVVTVAGAAAENVVGIVYVAGFALEQGESCADVSKRFPDTLLGRSLRPAAYRERDVAEAIELYLRLDAFQACFAGDLGADVAGVLARTQRPVTAEAVEGRAAAAAWRTLPTRYVVAARDRALDPAAQRFMAARAGATTVEADASHAILTSHPEVVAEQIALAARLPARAR